MHESRKMHQHLSSFLSSKRHRAALICSIHRCAMPIKSSANKSAKCSTIRQPGERKIALSSIASPSRRITENQSTPKFIFDKRLHSRDQLNGRHTNAISTIPLISFFFVSHTEKLVSGRQVPMNRFTRKKKNVFAILAIARNPRFLVRTRKSFANDEIRPE